MEQKTPTNKELALILFSQEWAGGSDTDELRSAIQRTFAALNARLSTRLGSGGYHVLLKRAVTLARADVPWLASVDVVAEGILEGFESAPGGLATAEIARGVVAVMAALIELLDTFIGRKLCLRVLRDAWPDFDGTADEGQQGDGNGSSG